MRDRFSQDFLKKHVNYAGNDCLIWPYAVWSDGYGHIKTKGKRICAHRLMCEVAHGPAPIDRPNALHTCNNPPCINPNHLYWGTKSENALDYYAQYDRNRA